MKTCLDIIACFVLRQLGVKAVRAVFNVVPSRWRGAYN